MKINTLLFTKIMTSLLKSGLVLQDALNISRDIFKSKNDRKFAQKILDGVENGNSLSKEISVFENQFGSLYISLLKIGEESGKLCDVFEKLGSYLEEKKERKEKLVQSMMYPLVVLITALLVAVVCIFFVFPKLEGIFEAFGEGGDALEAKIGALKTGVIITGIILISLIFLFVMMGIICKKNKTAKFTADKILIKTPFLGKEIIFNQTKDFSFSMKILTSTFYPFNESLKLSASVVSNQFYKNAVLVAYEKIMKGNDIAESFEDEKIFPPYFTSWIRLSQRNGNLNGAFNEIYEYFRTESENSSKRFGNAIEPLFILITGLIVIFIISQFVLPVFRLMGTL